MKASIIHFSDIHIEEEETQNWILTKSEKIIEALRNSILESDAIVLLVSGDFTFSGKKEEYALTKMFLGKLKDDLKEYTKKDVFCIGVPGNHDCDFSGDQSVRELLIDGLEKTHFENVTESVIDQCCKVQSAYYDFEREFLNEGLKVNFQDNLLTSVTLEKNGHKIVFNCMNTAWTSKLNEKEGKLAFPEDLYDLDTYKKGTSVNISVIHHPLNWQTSGTYRKLKKYLIRHSDITLSGHEHEKDMLHVQDANNKATFFIEASALQESGKKGVSGFNLIEIDLKTFNLNLINFKYNDGHFSRKTVLKGREIKKYILAPTNIYALKPEFEDYLDSLGAQIAHRRVEEVFLDDLFVDSLLRTNKENSEEIEVINFGQILNNKLPDRIVIIGEEISGKTALSKKLFRHYIDGNFVPILISAKDMTNPTIEFIWETLIREAFQKQYSELHHGEFANLDKRKIVLIIDSFHLCELAGNYRNNLIENLNELFSKIVYTGNSRLFFNPISEGEMLFEDYVFYDILEMSYEQRYTLIEKWNSLNENALVGNDLIRKNESFDKQVKSFLGKNFLPNYPIIVVTALQAIEFGNASDQGAFKYYYKFLIEEALNKHVSNKDELQFFNLFLSEYCYFLFDNSLPNIDRGDFETYFEKYTKKMKVKLHFQDCFNQLLSAKILKCEGDFVNISYNYIYYYYVALYFSNNLEKDEELKICLKKMIERLYVDEYANIIIFITQISTNSFVVEDMQTKADSYFDSYDPSSLSDDIEQIDKLMKDFPKLIITENMITDGQSSIKKQRNHAEVQENALDNSYRSKEYNIDEDISSLSMLNRFIRAVKTFEILGQVIKKNWGAYAGLEKELYLSSVYNLSMRVLSAYYDFISKNEEDLLEHIYYIGDKREITSRDELRSLAKKYIFHYAYSASHGLIKRAANATGHKQLLESIDDIIEKEPTNALKLIKLSIKLDHLGQLPMSEIQILLEKDQEFKKYFLPKLLVRNFVYQYLKLFNVPHDERNKLCELVGIEIKKQRVVQGSSKEKKKK